MGASESQRRSEDEKAGHKRRNAAVSADQRLAEYIRQLEAEDNRKRGEIHPLRDMLAQFMQPAADTRKIAKKTADHQPAA